MTKLMNQFRCAVRQTSIAKDERGLATVEYVIILVLVAAGAVGAWVTFGDSIKSKITMSQGEMDKVTIGNGSKSKSP